MASYIVAPRQWPSVTIVVCTHNRQSLLPELLESLYNQDYPAFDIILVDERNTPPLSLPAHDKLHIIRIEETPATWDAKKHALQIGLAAAKGDWLLYTDDDCLPASQSWIKLMVGEALMNGKQVVAGLSPYRASGKAWLDSLIAFETQQTALRMAISLHLGKPHMVLGRNYLIKRSLAQDTVWPDDMKGLCGGDDDLWIQQVRAQHPGTRFGLVTHPSALMYSIPPVTWRGWFRQKRRHLRVSDYYNPNARDRTKAIGLGVLGLTVVSLALYLGYGPLVALMLLLSLLPFGDGLKAATFLRLALGLPLFVFLMPYVYLTRWKESKDSW